MNILFVHQDLGTIGLYSMIIEKFFNNNKIDFITRLEKDYFKDSNPPELIISSIRFAQFLLKWSTQSNYKGQLVFLKDTTDDDIPWNLPHSSPNIHLVNLGALKSFKLRLNQILKPRKISKKNTLLMKQNI